MKYLFVFLFFVLFMSVTSAQNWRELIQAPIGLKYDVPQGWYVGGYMHGKTCDCNGATINSSKDQTINMVIFKDTIALDSLKKQIVWDYSFAPFTLNTERFQTDFFTFKKSISTWNEDRRAIVFRFSMSHNGSQYLIYFWGYLEDLTRNAKNIEIILKSIQGI
ncbi:MAG: hypothetical protein ACI976_002456 [Aureispira sp.]|jgi:hypothetical protein